MTTADQLSNERFDQALENFKDAASQLVAVWQGERDGDSLDVDNYPEYLPSFDEFALDVREIKRAS